ncbi:MAG TPA: GNAT family N-acetyltransferase [Thermoanaerobaculia bacterium]|nr:GNAT family N-acetyltransferase [Thermoanaerobaculia bacterium]
MHQARCNDDAAEQRRAIVSGVETYRAATRADIPALSTLFLEVFGVERDERVWDWKLFSNPRGSASFLCEAGGRVVSHCAGTPVTFRDGTKSYRALQSVDFMSSPTYSGGMGRGGVFVRTVKGFFEMFCGPLAAPLLYGFPGERHRILGERLLGYRAIERVTELSLGGHKEKSLEGRTDATANRVSRRLPLPTLTPKMLDSFKSPDFDFGAERDRSYLHWRYLEHPHKPYSMLSYRRWPSSPMSAIVRETGDVLYVMELGGTIDRRNVLGLTAKMHDLGVPVKMWCPTRHPVGQLLTAAGWLSSEKDHSIECRFFIERPVPMEGEMYYTLGDYDVH